jgi:putative photosynthetic complex assembly protein
MALTSTPFIPRPVLWGAAAMMLATFVAATLSARLQPSRHAVAGPTTHLRELRFADRADGAVSVLDASSGRTIETLHGEQGFLRGVLRGLAQERLRRGLGSERPFLLMVGGDGRLALVDPTTHRRIDLESFGRDQTALFARWLDESADPPARP